MRPVRHQPLPGHLPGGGVTQPSDDAHNTAAAAEKKRMRPLYLAARNALTREERAAADEALCGALLSSPLWQAARLVCLYVPMRGEADILPLLSAGSAAGKRIALPVCEKAHNLSFRLVPDSGADFLRPGPYGTREPDDTCIPLPQNELDGALMLIPGLSFDDEGYRLGYGGGYYDNLLRALSARGIAPVTVGAAYACCLAARLPRRTQDIPVRYVLSERGLAAAHAKQESFPESFPL